MVGRHFEKLRRVPLGGGCLLWSWVQGCRLGGDTRCRRRKGRASVREVGAGARGGGGTAGHGGEGRGRVPPQIEENRAGCRDREPTPPQSAPGCRGGSGCGTARRGR